MAILSLDDYIAATKQEVSYTKTATRTTVAAAFFSLFDLAGIPGAGTLAGSSTTVGSQIFSSEQGCPSVSGPGPAQTLYLSRVSFDSTVACRIKLYDLLYKAGAYSFNSNVTLSGQPTITSRRPDANVLSAEIWIETVTAFTGNLSVAVQYSDGFNTSGKTTGTVATGVAPTVGRMIQLPLQAGVQGVSKINVVTASVATAGTFNVLVLDPIWQGRINLANGGDVHGLDRVGLVPFANPPALFFMVAPDSTSSGMPCVVAEISSY